MENTHQDVICLARHQRNSLLKNCSHMGAVAHVQETRKIWKAFNTVYEKALYYQGNEKILKVMLCQLKTNWLLGLVNRREFTNA